MHQSHTHPQNIPLHLQNPLQHYGKSCQVSGDPRVSAQHSSPKQHRSFAKPVAILWQVTSGFRGSPCISPTLIPQTFPFICKTRSNLSNNSKSRQVSWASLCISPLPHPCPRLRLSPINFRLRGGWGDVGILGDVMSKI